MRRSSASARPRESPRTLDTIRDRPTTSPPVPVALLLTGTVAAVSLLAGCGGDADSDSSVWGGTIDTLATGQIVVTNPNVPLGGVETWAAAEELRIGALDDPGPRGFGQIRDLDVDGLGRIWVLEGQASEIRVFGPDGAHVRTVGRSGGGPGEFNGPAHMDFGPDGHLWVADPPNNRISVIDSAGVFVHSIRMEGGFAIFPWPGGFDVDGHYYLPVPYRNPETGFGIATVRNAVTRSDSAGPVLAALDTIPRLASPIEGDSFELTSENGRLVASVPYTPGFRTHRSRSGTSWGLQTGDYRFFEVDRAGDTLRAVRVAYDPLPVTAEDREAARENLKWFTDQGGRVDISRIPDRKPAAWSLFVDDAGRVWVDRITELPGGQVFDVFDPAGRFLGRVELPVPLSSVRRVVGPHIYGVTSDELGVPYVVRLRIGMDPGA